MKKLKLEIELNYDNKLMHGKDKESMEWFFKEILGVGELYLHSNELGDTVGTVKILKIGGKK